MEYIFKIKYDKEFYDELIQIYLYIKHRLKEEKIAQKNISNTMKKIETLRTFPRAHKIFKKEKDFEYRKFIIKNYVIIYRINLKEKEINILHIYNQKQKH